MISPADSRRSALESVIGATLATTLWAVCLNAILELLQSGGDFVRLAGYNLQAGFKIFMLSALVIWVVVLLVLALTGRLWPTFAITLVATLIIGVIDHKKLELRREPVYPSDIDFLSSPGFLVDMVGGWTVVLAAAFLLLLATGVVFLGRFPSRVFKPIRRRTTPRIWLAVAGTRLIVICLCLTGLHYFSHFNAEGHKLKQTYDNAGAQWAWWSQQVNYQRNGVVAGLLYNLDVPPMEVPPGYGKQAIEAISRKYAATASATNAQRDPRALDDVNVVIVLGEAFADPTVVKGVEIEGDPIPYTREVMRENTSGTMLAQLMGGGTANIEYEVLTGLSLAEYQPQMNSPYQMLVPRYKEFASAVGYFNAREHRTLAIHPFFKHMYKRERVYPIFGFDKFIDIDHMSTKETVGDNDFISDEAAFAEALQQLEASEQPALVNLVTMQNHFPMADKYDDPWPVRVGDKKVRKQLGGYARGLKYSDDAMRGFLAELSHLDEKTAVLFYGDHQPAIWNDEIVAENGDPAMKSTPFFMWTNFETEKQPTPKLLSPIHFLPVLFDQLGAQEPPFYALLDALRVEVPAMEQGVAYDENGALLEPGQLGAKAREVLADYRMVLYDLSVGERYSQTSMFYAPATESASAAGQQP